MRFQKIKVNVKKVINAKYDDKKEFILDPKGYVLIRLNRKLRRIEVGIADNRTNTVHTQINGNDARAIYYTIAKKNLLSRSEHYAYLGRELMKAQIALRMNIRYIQDAPLPINELKKDPF